MLSNFLEKVFTIAKPGYRVLDLGAGDGRFVAKFAELGCSVIAVDRRPHDIAGVVWRQQSVEDFLAALESAPDEKFDIIFARNIIQFVDKEWFYSYAVPVLKNHLNTDGVIAISTFFEEPVPPFASLHNIEELKRSFVDMEVVHQAQYEKDGPDMSGQERLFAITEIVVKKV